MNGLICHMHDGSMFQNVIAALQKDLISCHSFTQVVPKSKD